LGVIMITLGATLVASSPRITAPKAER